MTREEADQKLAQILRHSLERDRLILAQRRAVNAITEADAPAIAEATAAIERLEAEIEEFCRATVTADEKHIDLVHGRIGLRAAAVPALVPLDAKWTWKKIESAVKRIWKARFFHKPKPPALDKVAIKRELTPEEMKKVGLKLDETEHFYVEMVRLDRAA